MKNLIHSTRSILILAAIAVVMFSCGKKGGTPTATNPGKYSTATGLEYNSEEGFQVAEYRGQPEGPNLVFIEGGRTVLGAYEEDIMTWRDNVERTVTVASFLAVFFSPRPRLAFGGGLSRRVMGIPLPSALTTMIVSLGAISGTSRAS